MRFSASGLAGLTVVAAFALLAPPPVTPGTKTGLLSSLTDLEGAEVLEEELEVETKGLERKVRGLRNGVASAQDSRQGSLPNGTTLGVIERTVEELDLERLKRLEDGLADGLLPVRSHDGW